MCLYYGGAQLFFKLTGFSLTVGNWLKNRLGLDHVLFGKKGKTRPNASLKLTTELDC